MLRLFVSQNADDVLLQPETGFIATWLNSHTAWEDDHHGPNEEPTLREPIEDGHDPFYAADWRFVWTESKAELLDNLWGHVKAYAPWARVGYHACTHDMDDGGPCSWDDARHHTESGATIPSHVPSFDISE